MDVHFVSDRQPRFVMSLVASGIKYGSLELSPKCFLCMVIPQSCKVTLQIPRVGFCDGVFLASTGFVVGNFVPVIRKSELFAKLLGLNGQSLNPL